MIKNLFLTNHHPIWHHQCPCGKNFFSQAESKNLWKNWDGKNTWYQKKGGSSC